MSRLHLYFYQEPTGAVEIMLLVWVCCFMCDLSIPFIIFSTVFLALVFLQHFV